MTGNPASFNDRRSAILGRPCCGHTLVELATVVAVLCILACVAVPRLNLAAVWAVRTDAVAARLATDLRHTRVLAITHAARNPQGFALMMNGSESQRGYRIIDLHARTVVTTCSIPAGVECRGGQRFEFGPLGNVQGESDTSLTIMTEGRAYLIEVVPATGAVTWHRVDQ